jgi:GNAT superfamily N-acetyltransferase
MYIRTVRNKISNGTSFRIATPADLPGIWRVRTSVLENLLTEEQLEQRGITQASVAASFLADAKGWVAEHEKRVIAFSIADRASRSIFALFVLPAFERRGIGGKLLDLALEWLWTNGAQRVWLTSGPQTRAARFYEKRGWIATGIAARGDVRYERSRPNDV